jgi:hypothetical protein
VPQHAAHSGAYTSSPHHPPRLLVVSEAPHVAPESQRVGVSPTRWPQDADGISLGVKALAYQPYDFRHSLRTLRLHALISMILLLFWCFVYVFTYGALWYAPLATSILSFSQPRNYGTTLVLTSLPISLYPHLRIRPI